MHIGFLVAQFPNRSETFVSREVLNLRKIGFTVDVIAFAGPSEADLRQMPGTVQELARQVTYIGRSQAMIDMIRATPRANYRRMWALNEQIQQRAVMSSQRWLRLARACAVAMHCEANNIPHLHAHWPYASQVAALVHALNGTPYSISIHAHEVAHDNGHFPLLFDTLSFATFCNRAAMDYLLSELGSQYADRSHLVYHGVDLSAFVNELLKKDLELIQMGGNTTSSVKR